MIIFQSFRKSQQTILRLNNDIPSHCNFEFALIYNVSVNPTVRVRCCVQSDLDLAWQQRNYSFESGAIHVSIVLPNFKFSYM